MDDGWAAGLIDELIDEDGLEYDDESWPDGAAAIMDDLASGGSEAASSWPVVGQRIALHSPAFGDFAGAVTTWEVAASSAPFVSLNPLGEPLPLVPGMPVMLSLRSGPRLNELEGVVTDVWSTGHLNVRLTPPAQRRYPRYRRAIKVQLQWLDPVTDEPQGVSGVSVDLSFGGLRLRVLGPITRGERLFVFIPVPRQDAIQAVARVVRELPPAADGWREVGLEFTTVSEAHRARLLQFLSGQPVH